MRYVVLHHTGIPNPHYDLMLDVDGVSLLQTFQLSQWPIDGRAQYTMYTITRIADHRRIYLDYEGPISRNRGQVRRVTTGHYTRLNDHAIQLDGNLTLTLPAQ